MILDVSCALLVVGTRQTKVIVLSSISSNLKDLTRSRSFNFITLPRNSNPITRYSQHATHNPQQASSPSIA